CSSHSPSCLSFPLPSSPLLPSSFLSRSRPSFPARRSSDLDVLDEMAPARPADDKALVTEHAERQPHGVAGGPEALFQLFFRFQLTTGLQLPFLDLLPQRTGDLPISALCPHKTPPMGNQKIRSRLVPTR